MLQATAPWEEVSWICDLAQQTFLLEIPQQWQPSASGRRSGFLHPSQTVLPAGRKARAWSSIHVDRKEGAAKTPAECLKWLVWGRREGGWRQAPIIKSLWPWIVKLPYRQVWSLLLILFKYFVIFESHPSLIIMAFPLQKYHLLERAAVQSSPNSLDTPGKPTDVRGSWAAEPRRLGGARGRQAAPPRLPPHRSPVTACSTFHLDFTTALP